MAGKGGRNPGAGRPKLMEADKAQKMCQAAFCKKYNVKTFAEALEKMLDEPFLDASIKKFILQHALGNVPQQVNNTHSGSNGEPLIPSKIMVEVVRTEHNKNVDANAGTDEGKNVDSL